MPAIFFGVFVQGPSGSNTLVLSYFKQIQLQCDIFEEFPGMLCGHVLAYMV